MSDTEGTRRIMDFEITMYSMCDVEKFEKKKGGKKEEICAYETVWMDVSEMW